MNRFGSAGRPGDPRERVLPPRRDHASDASNPALLGLLAAGAGLSVATLYYNQPLLGTLASDLRIPGAQAGWVPSLTQLGYALGILFLAPLGDRFDRRGVILAKGTLLVGALLLVATARGGGQLLGGSLLVGLMATLAQDFVPAAAALAPEAQRGRVVGSVMTGLLLGILLSRVAGGLLAARFGWRWTFGAAALSILGLLIASLRHLPSFAPTTTLGYGALLASLRGLVRTHGALRRAALCQGLLAVGFSGFWSTLALFLHGAPFHLGAASAGAYGLAGAAGALAAPLAGRAADRKGPRWVAAAGGILALVSFLPMLAFPVLSPRTQLWLLGLCAAGFDLGIQASLIAHQTLIYGLDPGARSRLNALLFVGMFLGMAAGSMLAALLFRHAGWTGVSLLAILSCLLGVLLRRR